MEERTESPAPLRVLAVGNFDSFLRAADLVAREFAAAGAKVEMALLRTREDQISSAQLARARIAFPAAPYTIEQLCSPETLARFDVFVMALDGSAFRRFFLRMAQHEGFRPLFVAVYPSVVLRYHFDGLAARAPSDFLWLNSQTDLALYRDMCSAFGVDAGNGRAFGLSALLSPIPQEPHEGPGTLLFCEQAVIPRNRVERDYLADQLVALARRFPARQVVVKPRHRSGEYSLHRTEAHIETVLPLAARRAGCWPDNLVISHHPIEMLLAQAAMCLTISSTVALQAIHAGVPTAIVSDFGAHEDHGLPFFFGSGLLAPFAGIDPDNPPQPEAAWLETTLLDPRSGLPGHIAEIEDAARANRADPRPVRHLAPLVFGPELERTLLGRFGVERVGARHFRPRFQQLSKLFSRRWGL